MSEPPLIRATVARTTDKQFVVFEDSLGWLSVRSCYGPFGTEEAASTFARQLVSTRALQTSETVRAMSERTSPFPGAENALFFEQTPGRND